jgi:hypothetical protein
MREENGIALAPAFYSYEAIFNYQLLIFNSLPLLSPAGSN